MATARSGALDKPKFRQEQLVAEPVDDKGARFIDVMDPDSGSVFRFYEVEFSLACAMDGERDVAGIVQWAKEELGLTPSQAEIQSVIATLGELGYLEPRHDSDAPELATGIVVGPKPDASAPSNDFELGYAGPATSAVVPAPASPTFTLGSAGSTPRSPAGPVEDVALGTPGRTGDVSLDLSEHLAVRPDDVKEAVRASKVMTAADVPSHMLEALEEPKPMPVSKPAPVVVKPAPVVANPIEGQPKTPGMSSPSGQPSTSRGDRPGDGLRPTPAAKPVEPVKTAPKPSVSPVLIVLLIIALGVGAYFLWRNVLASKNHDEPQGRVQQPVAPVAQQPAPPAPPTPEPVRLAIETPAPVEVKAAIAGTIDSVDSAKVVKRDAVVAKLRGYQALEAEVKKISKQLERAKADIAKSEAALAAAKSANNTAEGTRLEADVAKQRTSILEGEAALAAKTTDLEHHLVKATADGELAVVAKPGSPLAVDGVVFTITRPAGLSAKFKTATAVKPGGYVFVELSGSGDTKPLVCEVVAGEQDTAKVFCSADPTLDGKEVTLGGEAPSPETVPAPPKLEGSAPPPSGT